MDTERPRVNLLRCSRLLLLVLAAGSAANLAATLGADANGSPGAGASALVMATVTLSLAGSYIGLTAVTRRATDGAAQSDPRTPFLRLTTADKVIVGILAIMRALFAVLAVTWTFSLVNAIFAGVAAASWLRLLAATAMPALALGAYAWLTRASDRVRGRRAEPSTD